MGPECWDQVCFQGPGAPQEDCGASDYSPLQAGEESRVAWHFLFFRADEDPAPEIPSQLLGPPFCHSWPVVSVQV